jgi:hypothetical protein
MDAKWINADARGPPVPMLGPYENAEPDTRTLRMRYAIRVPQKYLSIVLLGVTYQPHQLYDELVVTIRANGDEAMRRLGFRRLHVTFLANIDSCVLVGHSVVEPFGGPGRDRGNDGGAARAESG